MGDQIGTVAELWRYPVKSMGGERLQAVAAGERGLAGDRGWAIRDAETGKIASAKRPKLWLTLLECAAAYVDEPPADGEPGTVEMTLPDGARVRSDAPDRDRLLSEALGRPVTLINSAPEGAAYELREVDAKGLEAEEPERVAESAVGLFAPGTFFDTSSLHMVADGTLRRLAQVHPDGEWDQRRFRPNIVVALDGAADGFVENAWVGHALHIGTEAQAAALAPMPRCVMTTLPQGELPRDPLILRTIAQENRVDMPEYGSYACVGVLANFTAPGTVRAGDAVALGAPL